MRLSWGCDNFKAKNIFILSQTEPWEILVRVAIPTRTACARGYSHAHNTLILVYISVRVAIATRTCAWLSHAHVYSIQIRIQVCKMLHLSESTFRYGALFSSYISKWWLLHVHFECLDNLLPVSDTIWTQLQS